MKLATVSCLIGPTTAFVPANNGRTSTNLAVNTLGFGVTEPLGIYDPFGWIKTKTESFDHRRAVERKHRRICIIALI